MPVRVLWLIKGLGPGGAEQLLVSAARTLPDDVEVTVGYVVAEKRALVPALEEAGATATLLGGGTWRWPLDVRRAVRSGRFEVVHSHSPLLATVARLAAVGLGRRRPALLTTEHNGWSTFAVPTRLANALTVAVDDHILAVSERVRASIWWPRTRRRTEVLIHGIDLAAAHAAVARRVELRSELGAAPDDVVVATVANYRRQKAYPNLLRAARQVLDRRSDVRFVAVGQGPLEADVRALHRELALGDRFRLLGQRDDVPAVLAAADLFVLASDYEGLSVAILEAMAAGLPVVATAVGGVPEVVADREVGLLVAPGDPDALADAVERLAADGAWRRALGAAAEQRSDRFDIRRVGATLDAHYRSLARRR